MKSILIQINNQGIRISKEIVISPEMTNIPFAHLSFSQAKEIFWEVGMIKFDKDSGTLYIKVTDYHPSETQTFLDQVPKQTIKRLIFEPLHWEELQKFLVSYKKKDLEVILAEKNFQKPKNQKAFQVEVKIPLSKLSFHMGYISFQKAFKWSDGVTEFKIFNSFIIPEYEYIKMYFQKVIRKKTIIATIHLESEPGKTKIQKVTSEDVSKINDESIQLLKIQTINQWIGKKPKLNTDKTLFDINELMEIHEDDAFGNIDNMEKELLFSILGREDIRNKNQLIYLSEKVHLEQLPLLMTLDPQFGFIFIHRGEEMTHMIWELLDSHATYIWSSPLSFDHKLKGRLEQEIKIIAEQGRTHYRAHFEPEDELFFHVVHHNPKDYSIHDYFPKWKLKVNSLLI